MPPVGSATRGNVVISYDCYNVRHLFPSIDKNDLEIIGQLALGHALWSIWADGSSFEWNRELFRRGI